MRFEIKGIPICQARHRICNGRTYDPRSEIKKTLKWEFVRQMKENGFNLPKDKPLSIEMTIHTPIAESFSNVKRMRLDESWDINAPDIDNYVKFYFDTMNRIVYEDDRFISRLFVEKKKSLEPRIEITISVLEQKKENEDG